MKIQNFNENIKTLKNTILTLDTINFDFSNYSKRLFDNVDHGELESYIDDIKSITQADYGEFDSMRIHEYAYALRDLSSIQAESLLSTQGLNQTQIVETLAIKDSINARKELKSLDSDLTKNTKAATPAMSEWKATLKSTTTLIWDQVKAIGSWLTKTHTGWTTLTVAGLAAVVAGINAYNKSIDNAVTNAQDKLTETEGLLSSLSSERDTIIQKIKELEELERNGSLSIVEKTDLQALKDQNEELRIRQLYLNKQQEAESQELVEAAKKKYNRDYGYQELSRDSIDTYKEAFAEKTAVPQQTSSYLTDGTSSTSPSYAPGIQAQQSHTESQSLAALIAKYEYLTEAKKKASQTGNTKVLEKYEAQLTNVGQELFNNQIKLREFSTQLSVSGETSDELDDVNHKLKLINNTLYASEKAAFHFINDKFFQSDKKKLVELSETTRLTEEELDKNYSDIAAYIKENGLSINDLNSVIKTYQNELISTTPPNVNSSQMIESAKNDLYGHFVSPSIGLNETALTQATKEYEDWISKFTNDDMDQKEIL